MIRFANDLDELLGGGITPGVITHVFGPPASGKTNLALMATYNALGSGKVIYVDPEGGFNIERLRQISAEKTEEVLNNTMLVKPMSFEELGIALEKLDDILCSMPVSLIVVDSIAMLYRMEEDKDVRKLGRMLATLLRLARKHNIAVLLTNQVYSDYETKEIRPIGGQITEYFTKNIIELTRDDQNFRYAILRRHVSKHEGETLKFRIVERGIETIGSYCVTKNPMD